MVSTFSLAEAIEADIPAGPPPITKTSVSARMGIFLIGSSINFIKFNLLTNF
ncbi:MAG: hypothetical protein ACFFDF_20655 [Candidatus Odinarchaeota archaeon]